MIPYSCFKDYLLLLRQQDKERNSWHLQIAAWSTNPKRQVVYSFTSGRKLLTQHSEQCWDHSNPVPKLLVIIGAVILSIYKIQSRLGHTCPIQPAQWCSLPPRQYPSPSPAESYASSPSSSSSLATLFSNRLYGRFRPRSIHHLCQVQLCRPISNT